MKHVLLIVITFIVLVTNFCATACAEEVSLSAQAYVLYCVENDEVLLSKNADQQMKMASTTKIMTTLLALEQCEVDDVLVEFTDAMIAEGSSMYLKVGDAVHLSDLAVGMMLSSGNDAANAAAITIGGSVPEFSILMNKRAKEIGMHNTHFVTPSGLDSENHYSTALDMAYLMAEALKNEQFCEIAKSTQMTVDFLTPQKQVTYHNHNRLLSMYEYCIAGKTGYTKSAGRCLVTAAKKDGLTLVAVTLNAPSDWNDHIALYDYGFEHYTAVDTDDTDEHFSVDVVGGDVDEITLSCGDFTNAVISPEDADKVVRTVYIPQFLYAPVLENECIGTVVYTLNDEIIAQNSLYSDSDVNLRENDGFWGIIDRLFRD